MVFTLRETAVRIISLRKAASQEAPGSGKHGHLQVSAILTIAT